MSATIEPTFWKVRPKEGLSSLDLVYDVPSLHVSLVGSVWLIHHDDLMQYDAVGENISRPSVNLVLMTQHLWCCPQQSLYRNSLTYSQGRIYSYTTELWTVLPEQ